MLLGETCTSMPFEMKAFRDFLAATTRCFRLYAVFRGRAGRKEFWYFLLFFFVGYVVVIVLDPWIDAPVVRLSTLPGGASLPLAHVLDDVGLIILLYRPVLFLPSAAVSVRRLHDIGKNGWWSLLWVLPVPILGWLVLVPWLLRPSDPHANAYGPATALP